MGVEKKRKKPGTLLSQMNRMNDSFWRFYQNEYTYIYLKYENRFFRKFGCDIIHVLHYEIGINFFALFNSLFQKQFRNNSVIYYIPGSRAFCS